jgi:ethanolamine utilization protein EutN
MQLARVIGDVVSTVKDPNLTGITLLVLQPITADGEPSGRTLVALDSVGAGLGEHVFFVRGREAAFPFYPGEPPADAAVIGIVDSWHMETPNSEGRTPKEDRTPNEGRTTKDDGRTGPGEPGR